MRAILSRMEEWRTWSRPGYFGSSRDARYRDYDDRFGVGNWRLAWQLGERELSFPEMCLVYEDAYYLFLKGDPETLDELCATCSDVYDDAVSNVASGDDYLAQETDRTHVQDIAVRRAVRRLGRTFAGRELLRIRDSEGSHRLSMTLSPGRIPFQLPELVAADRLMGWWAPGSVEEFYQSNKLLQVKAPAAEVSA